MPASSKYSLVALLDPKRGATFKTLLVELGQEVRVARDGDEAQQLIGTYGAPQLLIADVSLPRTDGLTLLRQLRQDAPASRMGAIVVSSHESLRTQSRQVAESLGISRVLPADADRTALREAVQSALPQGAAVKPAAVPAHTGPTDVLNVDHALDYIALDAARRFAVPICVAYLKSGGRERVVAHLAVSSRATLAIDSPEIAFMRQLAGAREPLVLPDLQAQPLHADITLSNWGAARGLAAVPLTFDRSDATGLLCLIDTHPLTFSARELDDVSAFASEASRQIEEQLERTPAPSRSALMAEEIEALELLAVTDPLTGLANRRGGEQNITSEIARAKRQKTPLSCIMVDIDRFKTINDTYGHQAGDHVLREIGTLLRRALRAYDILVRWGGDEFLIVLPGVDLARARKLAERVRAGVETLETQGIGFITISGGAATLDQNYDFESMLATADRQLYQAKAAGRNCVS